LEKATIVFTDIVDSSKLWQMYPNSMLEVLAAHDNVIKKAVEVSGGSVVKHTGDGFMLHFTNRRAIECALLIRKEISLQNKNFDKQITLTIRIGIHNGKVIPSNNDYYGNTVNLTARVMSKAFPGQILITNSSVEKEILPSECQLIDQGEVSLKGFFQPVNIFSLTYPSIDRVFPSLEKATSKTHNLPAQITKFIGRFEELNQIFQKVKKVDERLLTILGLGGSGKTRIAVEAGIQISEKFDFNVWFIPLEEANDLSSIITRIIEVITPDFARNLYEEQVISNFFRDQKALLILDNFENIVEYAPILTRLLEACPNLQIITTSRIRLGVRGETILNLPGLQCHKQYISGDKPDEAMKLFISSARKVEKDYSPSIQQKQAISAICQLLDGLPLGIELAASWVRLIPATELFEELKNDISILESTSTDRPDRQQSLEAVFNYSWGFLTDLEQKTLAALSIFDGGFSRNAANAVAKCDLKTLQKLCDHSFVNARLGSGHRLHQLTKQFAAEKLNKQLDHKKQILFKHSKYFSSFIEECLSGKAPFNYTENIENVLLEYSNIVKGAYYSYEVLDENSVEVYTKLLASFLQFKSELQEGVIVFSTFLKLLNKAGNNSNFIQKTRASLHDRIGNFYFMSRLFDEAIPHFNKAKELAKVVNDPTLNTMCFGNLGNLAYVQNDFIKAGKYWQQALEHAKQGNISRSISALYCNLALIQQKNGNIKKAHECLEEAQQIYTDANDVQHTASVTASIAKLLELEGNFTGAQEKYQQAIDLSESIGEYRGAATYLRKISKLLIKESPDRAVEAACKSFSYVEETGIESRVVMAHTFYAEILTEARNYTEALTQIELIEKLESLHITSTDKATIEAIKEVIFNK